jgi:hypothetical protein
MTFNKLMKDATLESIGLISIIAGVLIGYFIVFDYEPEDAFFLSEDESNAFIEGYIIEKRVKDEFTLLKIYGCRTFDAYSEPNISRKVNESITIYGSLSDDFFFIERYK